LTNAIVLCEIDSWLTGRRLVSLPFSDHCDLLVASAEMLPILSYLENETIRNNWKYLELRPLESVPGGLPGFVATTKYYYHELDLSPVLESLFQSVHKSSIRRKVWRAEREGLLYKKGTEDSLLGDFYSLFRATRRRQGIPPQPYAWFRNLIDSFAGALQIRVSYKKDRPVASILTLEFKDTLVYKYGCSDSSQNNLGGTQLLFWRAIEESKRAGLLKFDLGRSAIGSTGLNLFKERWGAKRSELTYVRFTPAGVDFDSPEGLDDWKHRFAKQVFAHAPDGIISAISNLLYKHVG
jgi:hypothetical protein